MARLFTARPVSHVPEARYLHFDLENRPLSYWYDDKCTAEITAIAWRYSDEMHTYSLLLSPSGLWSYDDDIPTYTTRRAFRLFREVLTRPNQVVTAHNVRRHDLPMFNAHLIEAGLDSLPPLTVSDTLADLPKMKDLPRSQKELSLLFGVAEPKVEMSQQAWREGNRLTYTGRQLTRGRVVGDVDQHISLRAELQRRGLLKAPRVWRP